MAEETATVKIRADLADFTTAIKTNTATTAGETERMAIAVQKSFLKMERAAREEVRALAAQAKEAKAAAAATQAHAAAAYKMSVSQNAVSTSGKKWTKANEETTSSLGRLGRGAEVAGQASAKMRGALSLLSPELADLAGGINDGADVLEVFAGKAGGAGVAIAAAGVLVGIGAIAWKTYHEDADRAAATTEMVRRAHENLQPILDSTQAATIRLKVATGELSEEQGALADNANRAFAALQQSTGDTVKKMVDLREEQDSTFTRMVDNAERGLRGFSDLGAATGVWGSAAHAAAFYVDGLTTNSKELGVQIQALDGELSKATEGYQENLALTDAVIVADGNARAAKEALADATNSLADQVERLLSAQGAQYQTQKYLIGQVGEYRAALDEMKRLQEEATEGEKNGQDSILDARNQMIDAIKEQEEAAISAATGDEARHQAAVQAVLSRAAVEESAQRQISEYRSEAMANERAEYDEWMKHVADENEKAADKAKDLISTQIGAASNIAGSLSDLYTLAADNRLSYIESLTAALEDQESTLTESQREALEEQIAAEKKAAMRSFTIQQAAAAAQAVVLGGIALGQAIASAPPPANIPAIIATGVATAANLATITSAAPPSFRGGGEIKGALPDVRTINAEVGEGIATRQGMRALGGEQGLRDLNAGRMPAAKESPIIVNNYLDGRLIRGAKKPTRGNTYERRR